MRKSIKYILTVSGLLVLGIVLIVLLALLLIQTEPAKNKIARIAETQASKFFDGNFTIGKIEGNFISNIELKNILITQNNDTVVFCNEINTEYNLLPLLKNRLEINSAEIIRPQVFLKQINDSVWNMQQLLKSPPKKEKEETTDSKIFYFNLSNFSLTEGFIKTSAFDSIIPQQIKNLNIELSASTDKNSQQASLKNFSFSTLNPDFTLKHLGFMASADKNFIELQNFNIVISENRIEGKAEYLTEKSLGNALFESSPLNLSEFGYFLPYLKIPANPEIRLKAETKKNKTEVTLDLHDQNQQISLFAESDNLVEFFKSEETILSYSVTGDFSNVVLEHWTGMAEIPYILNGNISASGKGINPETARINIKGGFKNWILQKTKTGNLDFDLKLNNGNLTGLIRGNGNFGSFMADSRINNLLKTPVYNADITLSNLNLEKLTGIKSLDSDINLTANISGKEFDLQKADVSARLNAVQSRFGQITIDTLLADALFKNQNFTIDTLTGKTGSANFSAEGNYSFTEDSDLKFDAAFSGLSDFSGYLPDSTIHSAGKINGRIYGRPDELFLNVSADLDSTAYSGVSMKKISLNTNAKLTSADTVFDARITILNTVADKFLVDSLEIIANGKSDSVNIAAGLKANQLKTQLNSDIFPEKHLKVNLNELTTEFKNQKWALQSPPATIKYDNLEIEVENFSMASAHNDMNQYIFIHGKTGKTDIHDFHIDINNLNLESVSQIFDTEEPASGIFGLKLSMEGKTDSLVLNTDFLIDEPEYDKLKLKTVSGNINFYDNKLKAESVVIPGENEEILFSAEIPVELKTDSLTAGLLKNTPIHGQLLIKNISLNKLNELEITDRVSGSFDAAMNLFGTVEKPLLDGDFAFSDTRLGNYEIPRFNGNAEYKNNLFTAGLNITPQDSGKLEARAELPVIFMSDSLKFSLNQKSPLKGNVKIEKFTLGLLQELLPNGNTDGIINGNIDISGTVEAPVPEGNIQLNNALLKIPEYGVDYRDIGLKLDFEQNAVNVNDFLIKSKNGNLSGSGRMIFLSGIIKGDISSSDVNLKFNKFQPFNHKQFNMQMDGSVTLGGTKGDVTFGGKVSIPRSEIYIPAILRMAGKMYVPDIPNPILIQEMEKINGYAPISDTIPLPATIPDSLALKYFDNFKGKLNISIPHNTWIKNDDLYIEISGDIELLKNYDFFELFGTVEVVRGQYDLLGKTFIVDEGIITFRGGEEIMPFVNLKASYRFRNMQRIEQKITVNVSGTAEKPEINFQLDGSNISEGDAISYIIFGKSMNELTIDEQDNMSDSGGAGLAEKAAISILSSQIAGFLGDKLAADYIEVKSDGGFDNATVVVGKYITNDIFMSYEQRFGETHEKDQVKYEVKLEYELFRFLFFELNNSSRSSGFNVIFKFDSK